MIDIKTPVAWGGFPFYQIKQNLNKPHDQKNTTLYKY